MADPITELARFEELVGGQNRPPTNVIGVSREQVVEAQDEISKFESIVGGVNAPPSGVSAVPNLSISEQQGRMTSSGEIIPIDYQSGFPNLDDDEEFDSSSKMVNAVKDILRTRTDYLDIANQRLPEDKVAVLERKYPGMNARVLDSGDVAVEVEDLSTGKLKDVVLNPSGIGAHDLIDLYAKKEEIGAAMAVAIAQKGRGFLKTVAQIVLSSFAGGAAGAAKDVYERGKWGLDIRSGEIAKERTKQAILDMGLQGVFSVGAKASGILSPFSREIKKESLEFKMGKAAEYFKSKMGVDYQMTPAQKSGSLALQAVEEAEMKMPGARNVASKIARKNEESVRKIQDIATKGKLSDEDAGLEAIDLLRMRRVSDLEGALEQAREAALKKGEKQVLDVIDETIGAKRGERVTQTMAGAAGREEYEVARESAKNAVGEAFGKVRSLPGGSGAILDGTSAALEAEAIRKELPSVVKTIQEKSKSGLTDEFGRPITSEVEKEIPLKSGIPEGLEKALSDLESLKGGKVSLDTLTKMKNAMYDEIAKIEAVPDVTDRWFGNIAKAYDKGIDSAIEATNNPELKKALTDAREIYKEKMLPFDKLGVRGIARSEFDAGSLSEEAIFNRLFQGENAVRNYTQLKSLLGEKSPAFVKIKRAWVDLKLAEVSDTVTGLVDPNRLEALFKELGTSKKELANEIFGKNSQKIFNALRVNQVIKKTGHPAGMHECD